MMTRSSSNRSGFEQRLLATLRDIGVAPATRLTVGFSGGRDSLALAAGLSRVAPLLGADIRLVHVDHRLRTGSAEDAIACRGLADALGLAIEILTLKPGLPARSTGIGLEEAGRRERYLALARSAADWGSTDLVLGHQSNDQAETVLMHLFRGAALDGLAGMRLVERRQVPWWDDEMPDVWTGNFLRPLLAETRNSIDEYVAQLGLRPIEDESNRSTVFDRNWVRLKVLPSIAERWPAAIESIQRSSHALDTDRRYLDELADKAAWEAIRNDRTLCTDTVSRLHPSIAARVIDRWLRVFGIEDVDHDVIDRVYSLALAGNETQRIEIGDGQVAVLANQRLTTADVLIQNTVGYLPLDAPESGIVWAVDCYADPHPGDFAIEVPTAAQPMVRRVQPGDRWFGGRRTVREDLRTAGIHPLLRDRVLAVVVEEGVLLIPAIYPTIRSMQSDGPVKKVGVRWSRRS